MKKFTKIIAMAFVAGFIFASCESTDTLIQKLDKACKAGDVKEQEKIMDKLEKKVTKPDDLTPEQYKAMEAAVASCSESTLGK